FTKSFSLLTAIVTPSFAISNSLYLMPLSSNFFFSSSFIGLDAFEKSVLPEMNFSKPPPVPDVPDETVTSEFSLANFSFSFSMIGPPVDEPSPLTSPSQPPEPAFPPPQAPNKSEEPITVVPNYCHLFIETSS